MKCPHCGKEISIEEVKEKEQDEQQELVKKLLSLGFQGKSNSDDMKKVSEQLKKIPFLNSK